MSQMITIYVRGVYLPGFELIPSLAMLGMAAAVIARRSADDDDDANDDDRDADGGGEGDGNGDGDRDVDGHDIRSSPPRKIQVANDE